MSQNKTPKNNLPFVFKEYTFSELKEGESKFISDKRRHNPPLERWLRRIT